MKRVLINLLVSALAATGLAVGVGAATAAPASAAYNRPCMTKAEYNRIYRNQTPARVKQIVGSSGRTDFDVDSGYYAGEWVEDGYWSSYWVYDGYYDEYGNWVDLSYENFEWIDTSYFDEYANFVSVRDVLRTFSKCASWTGRQRRATVWYDNYTQSGSGMRVYRKYTYNWLTSAGRVAPSVGKDAPEQVRPPKPAPSPTTPKPEVDKPVAPEGVTVITKP